MIREQLLQKAVPHPNGFRWRGGDVSRVESFSDAVFGFALTLLVVSLEVPKTFDALAAAMRGFVGFAVCFVLLSMVWYDHYTFFRQYGLKDSTTIGLNLLLLFVVMFYVYPLKFLFTLLTSLTTGAPPGGAPVISASQAPALMIIYAAGFTAVRLVFALMYLNAYRQRGSLDLNGLERFDTLAHAGSHASVAGVGILSAVVAQFGGSGRVALSGFSYFLIGLVMTVYWSAAGSRRRRLESTPVSSVEP